MSSMNWADLVREAGDVAGFEIIPDGDYDMIVKEATHKPTSSGKTMFVIKAAVETGAHANRLVWDNLVVSPENANALAIFFRKMAALGMGPDYFKTSPTNAAIEQALIGRRFRAKIGKRTWQGNDKNELKAYFPAASSLPAGVAPPAPAPAPAETVAPAEAVPAPPPLAAPASPF